MKYIDFDTMQSFLKDYHDALNDRNPDLTYVPKMYINKDYWVTKISIPYDVVDIDVKLDDRTDVYPNPKWLVIPQAYRFTPLSMVTSILVKSFKSNVK